MTGVSLGMERLLDLAREPSLVGWQTKTWSLTLTIVHHGVSSGQQISDGFSDKRHPVGIEHAPHFYPKVSIGVLKHRECSKNFIFPTGIFVAVYHSSMADLQVLS